VGKRAERNLAEGRRASPTTRTSSHKHTRGTSRKRRSSRFRFNFSIASTVTIPRDESAGRAPDDLQSGAVQHWVLPWTWLGLNSNRSRSARGQRKVLKLLTPESRAGMGEQPRPAGCQWIGSEAGSRSMPCASPPCGERPTWASLRSLCLRTSCLSAVASPGVASMALSSSMSVASR